MTLVNVSLKFQMLISEICQYFFSAKNISVFGYKFIKHLTSWPLNQLVKLTALWTTGPRTVNITHLSKQIWGTWLLSQGSWVRYPVWQHTFVSPSAFSWRAVVSYWRKYVHEVLVNRLGGLSLPRKSVVRLTDRPDMTLDVYRGRKTTKQQQQPNKYASKIC